MGREPIPDDYDDEKEGLPYDRPGPDEQSMVDARVPGTRGVGREGEGGVSWVSGVEVQPHQGMEGGVTEERGVAEGLADMGLAEDGLAGGTAVEMFMAAEEHARGLRGVNGGRDEQGEREREGENRKKEEMRREETRREEMRREEEKLRMESEVRRQREDDERAKQEQRRMEEKREMERQAREMEQQRVAGEAQRQARQEAEERERYEAERRAKEEAERRKWEEIERRKKEEMERKRIDSEQKQKEEQERKEQGEKDRAAKLELERVRKEDMRKGLMSGKHEGGLMLSGVSIRASLISTVLGTGMRADGWVNGAVGHGAIDAIDNMAKKVVSASAP